MENKNILSSVDELLNLQLEKDDFMLEESSLCTLCSHTPATDITL